MRWITHQTAALAAGLALHLPPAGVAAVCVGAVLPDVLDQRLSALAMTRRGRQRLFNALHRGSTHWFGWWLAALAVGLTACPVAWREALSGCALGGISHVLLDMLTPQGVPLLPFSRRGRISLRLCATGSLGEYAFLACLVAAIWLGLGDAALELARHLWAYGRI